MQGLYDRYTVIDNRTGQQVEDGFFVLKLTDPVALKALMTYAEYTDDPVLATDLSFLIGSSAAKLEGAALRKFLDLARTIPKAEDGPKVNEIISIALWAIRRLPKKHRPADQLRELRRAVGENHEYTRYIDEYIAEVER